MVTAIVMAVHRPIFSEAGVFAGLAWVVTATPRAVPLPPLSGDQWLAVEI
jgi:C4-dicarboxylate transporter